jgi:hypothetical protein
LGTGNPTKVVAIALSLAVHGLIAWFSPEPEQQKQPPEKKERRIVARAIPKRVQPKQKVQPKKKPKDPSPDIVKKEEPKVIKEVPDPPAAKVPEPVIPKVDKKTKTKRAPKKRSGRNLTSKKKRPGTKAVAPGSKRGGPKNIGDWDPSGPAGPGVIDPNGGNTDGDRVERPPTNTSKNKPNNNGEPTGKTRRKKSKVKVRAAVPIYRPTPRWPSGLIKSGPIAVPVKVRLDPAGKIISAKAMGSAPKLAKKAAVSFVKSIRWRPARQGDKNVKFNLVYTVKFRP